MSTTYGEHVNTGEKPAKGKKSYQEFLSNIGTKVGDAFRGYVQGVRDNIKTAAANANASAAPTGTYEQYMQSSEYLKNATAEADKAREAAIVGADTSYQQARTTYGAKAEALQNMGLSGGGYSDYLEAQAYAQKRADVQAANAQHETTMRNARYQDYQNWKTEKEQHATNYATLMGMVKDGTLAGADVQSVAAKYGITDASDINALTTAATAYGTEKANAGYAKLMNEIYTNGYSPEQVRALAGAYGITDTAKMQELQNAAIIQRGVTAADIGEGENVDEELLAAYRKQQGEYITPDMFSGYSYEQVKDSVAEILNDPNLSEKQKTAVRSYFQNTYGISVEAAKTTVNSSTSAKVSGFNPKSGKNCTVEINGEPYKAQTKGEADPDTSTYLNSVFGAEKSDGSVVTYNGKIYVFSNSAWYQLEARGNGTEEQIDSWNELNDKLRAGDSVEYEKSGFRKGVEDTYNSAKTGVTNAYNSAKDWTVNTYNSAKDGIVNTYNSAKDGIVNAYNSAKDWTVDTYNSAKDWTVDTYNGAKDGIADTVSSTAKTTSDAVTKYYNKWLKDLGVK